MTTDQKKARDLIREFSMYKGSDSLQFWESFLEELNIAHPVQQRCVIEALVNILKGYNPKLPFRSYDKGSAQKYIKREISEI